MHMLNDLLQFVGYFGGFSAVILAISKARIDRMKAERQSWQPPAAASDPALLEELKALRQQMSEMQNTGHQFDISFDAALNRMESRVSRLETKSATAATTSPEMGQTLRNGQSQ